MSKLSSQQSRFNRSSKARVRKLIVERFEARHLLAADFEPIKILNGDNPQFIAEFVRTVRQPNDFRSCQRVWHGVVEK